MNFKIFENRFFFAEKFRILLDTDVIFPRISKSWEIDIFHSENLNFARWRRYFFHEFQNLGKSNFFYFPSENLTVCLNFTRKSNFLLWTNHICKWIFIDVFSERLMWNFKFWELLDHWLVQWWQNEGSLNFRHEKNRFLSVNCSVKKMKAHWFGLLRFYLWHQWTLQWKFSVVHNWWTFTFLVNLHHTSGVKCSDGLMWR